MQELTCRSCGANLHADDVNTTAGIAKCRYCQAVFAFGHAMGGSAAPAAGAAPHDAERSRPEVERPPGFAIEEDPYRFRITRRWLSWKVIPLALFAAFWNGFLVVWYSIGLRSLSGGDDAAWVMLLFPVLHVAVGLGLIYALAATCLNATTIDVNDQELSVRHGPLWFPGNKTLPALDVQQLYCKQKIRHGKNGASTTYEVHAVAREGQDEKFLAGLDQQHHALYVEQQVERVLGLKDVAVAGESL